MSLSDQSAAHEKRFHFKDEILDSLSSQANVAQFVSFDPDTKPRFSHVFGQKPNAVFPDIHTAVETLLNASSGKSVNVRSFHPADPKSREFVYGLSLVDEVVEVVKRLARIGLYTIVNETVDIKDGGVSGVALGDVIEFAPGDTPRCVEQPGTVSLSRSLGTRLLETVYGFRPDLPFSPLTRVEFSIHPLRRGVRNEHTIIWETEEVGESTATAELAWPNKFSRLIGDKAFGLLIAHLLKLPVPYTLVIPRRIAPFSFGSRTRSGETWLRTCPIVQVPGKFTTLRGWSDPYELLNKEDSEGTQIASILAQDGIDASYSGAVLSSIANANHSNALTIEGTAGFGDEFMVGTKKRISLPRSVELAVERLYRRAFQMIGPVRMEWVLGNRKVWIVQFHKGASLSYGNVIVPGEAPRFVPFRIELGLERLRQLIDEVGTSSDGIELQGDVGITSHFGDVLRRAQIPSRIRRSV
jgi:hypothetical protein